MKRILCLLLIAYHLLLALPIHAETNGFCFQKQECEQLPYSGVAREATDCKQYEELVKEGFIYNCYAAQPKVPLQVSLLGKTVNGLNEYVGRLFTYLIGISSLAAGLMIIWAGVSWLTSAGNPEKISEAKHKISNALIGVVLILGSYLILQTINPALVKLELPPIKLARQITMGFANYCVNRSEYPCGGDIAHTNGTWACTESPQNPPCGARDTGICLGQYCRSGGCYRFDQNKILLHSGIGDADTGAVLNAIQKRGHAMCINTNECSNCADLVDKTAHYNLEQVPDGVVKCVSFACDCVLGANTSIPNQTVFECYAKANQGQPCGADAQCKSNHCNFARTPNQCAPVEGEQGGAPCRDGRDCASHLCNTELDPDECAPVGGYQQNDACCNPEDSNANAICGNGFRCIDVPNNIVGILRQISCDGLCSNGASGAVCSNNTNCRSGICHQPTGQWLTREDSICE